MCPVIVHFENQWLRNYFLHFPFTWYERRFFHEKLNNSVFRTVASSLLVQVHTWKKEKFIKYFVAVFRIHDILGWIRIRIRGSMPLTNGSGSGSWIRILLFLSLTFKMPANLSKKQIFYHLPYNIVIERTSIWVTILPNGGVIPSP